MPRDPESGLVFDEWVVGYAASFGVQHAVRRRYGGLPGTCVVVGLCPARGGDGGLRATDTAFEPSSDRSCTECARLFVAYHMDPVLGWDRTCRTCSQDKPINMFRTDKRTKDQISLDCEDCIRGAKRVVAAANAAAREAANLVAAQERQGRYRDSQIESLRTFQFSPLLPSFTCVSGHLLEPVATSRTSTVSSRWPGSEWPGIDLRCPCGSVADHDVEDLSWYEVSAGVEALGSLAGLAKPRPVRIGPVVAT